jgi:glycosyltransferase involved in cell wall biosynthesis
MISFIVIGRNIEHTIVKCINSIINCTTVFNIDKYEIIYVDSKSNDLTLRLLSNYDLVRIFQLEGNFNAAIARNVGYEVSVFENLVFIDGDMELCVPFFQKVFLNGELQFDFVSGDLLNVLYNEKWEPLGVSIPYYGEKLEKTKIEYVTGGFFVIKKPLWKMVGGMDVSLRRGQDLDIGLRLSKRNIFLTRIPELFANHHTISYFNQSRFKTMIMKGDYLFPGAIIRKNFLNKYAWMVFLKWYSSAYLLALMLILMVADFRVIFIYLMAIILRGILKKNKEHRSTIVHVLAYIIIDINTIIGFLFFYPSKTVIKYKLISFEK